MKRLVTIVWGLLFTASAVAQVSTIQTTDTQKDQHALKVHKALYNARTPQLAVNHPEAIPVYEVQFDADTSWSYEEMKEPGEEMFSPYQFMQRFDEGLENDFKRTSKNYEWQSDKEEWQLNSTQSEWYADAFNDSSIYFTYNESGEPSYGDRQIYMRNPAEGATEEVYYDDFSASTGWEPYSHTLRFTNEEGTVSWTKSYLYSPDLGDYFFQHYTLSETEEDHYLYEYKMLSPTEITYWSKDYSLYDAEGNTVYMVYYVKPTDSQELEPSDSTSFRYRNGYAEAFEYTRSEGEWVMDRYSRTFESPSVKSHNGIKVDSVVTYALEYDAVGDSMKAGAIATKSTWTYDAHDNMILSESQTRNGTEMLTTDRSEVEYELIGNEYHQVLKRTYTMNFTDLSLYMYSENKSFYNEWDEPAGDQSLYFSETGDTTSGYKSRMFFEKEYMYTFSYQWDSDLHDFVQTNFIVHSEGEPVTQFSYIDETYGSSRYVDVMHGLPAVLNPGPVFTGMGETVDIILSARNPDMSFPSVEIENMPTTATFDPSTNRFIWTVDEADPEPMILRAVDGDQSTTTEVKFVTGEFTVGTEDEATVPDAAELLQNYPNPFNPTTTIEFVLNHSEIVNLQVYNILGQPVSKLLQNEMMSIGNHRVTFDASNLPSGIYYYQLTTANSTISKKMTLIK